MTHGFRNGVYRGWSPYFDYSSYESLKLSEKLPVPNKKQYSKSVNGVDISKITASLIEYQIANNTKEIPLEFIVDILNAVKDGDSVRLIDDELSNRILSIINKHNNFDYSDSSIKNYVVRNIIETSNHPVNQIASHSPIAFGELEEIKDQSTSKVHVNIYDGVSMDQQQETNAVGKDVIGIAANGIKDYFALVEYFNNYGDNTSKDSNKYFERTFELNGKKYTINRIGGLNLSKSGVDLLNKYVHKNIEDRIITAEGKDKEDLIKYLAEVKSREYEFVGDPALALSSLLSAATDSRRRHSVLGK